MRAQIPPRLFKDFKHAAWPQKSKERERETVALTSSITHAYDDEVISDIEISCTCGILLTAEIDNDLNSKKGRNVIHRQKDRRF